MAPSGRSFGQGAPAGFRPRVGTTSVPRSTTSQDTLPPDLDIMDEIEQRHLQSIAVPEVDVELGEVRVKDCNYIGSYNWLKQDSPTILVPGTYKHFSGP